MYQADWNYTRHELDTAGTSSNTAELSKLAHHESRFVRAQVAGNRHCPKELRGIRSRDTSRGVIGWLIGNPSLTKVEFDHLFRQSMKRGYCSVITPALASSFHADIEQLTQLAKLQSKEMNWNVHICILNNYRGRGDNYLELIRHLLPNEDTKSQHWTEIEKLAYLRTFGSRLRLKE